MGRLNSRKASPGDEFAGGGDGVHENHEVWVSHVRHDHTMQRLRVDIVADGVWVLAHGGWMLEEVVTLLRSFLQALP